MPANDGLGRRLCVSCGDRHDDRVLQRLPLSQRTPRLGDDPELLMLMAQAGLLEVGMQLDLIDRRRHAGLRDQALQVLSLIHISEPTRQAEISYAVFCLKK